MEKYSVDLTPRAKEQLRLIYKSGDKVIIKKIERLVVELSEHPKIGVGKPEQLKGVENTWSRRLDKKNRLVYTIKEEKILVLVLSVLGHYADK